MPEESILTLKFPKSVQVTPAYDLRDPMKPRQYLDVIAVGESGKIEAHLGWLYVGDAGYDWTPYTEPPPPPPPDPTPPASSRYHAAFNINLRATPSSTALLVGKIIAGSEVFIEDASQTDTPTYHWGRFVGDSEQWAALWKWKDSAHKEILETYLVKIP